MDIFNYLMNKKGKEIFKNNDILSYLLKKGRVHTATGTEITIHNAKGFNSLELSKLSTQDGTPTPESPVEVKTVKGYRNLFDKSTAIDGKEIRNVGIGTFGNNNEWFITDYIPIKANTTYKVSGKYNGAAILYYDENKDFVSGESAGGNTQFTTPQNVYYAILNGKLTQKDTFMVVEGSTSLPYVPYGTNWIYTTISDGTNTKNIPLPLNNNEIAGIGDYKDEYIVDKNGHCWLNKKTGKVVLIGNENWDVYGSGIFRLIINDVLTTDSSQGINVKSNYYENFSQMIVQGGSVDYGISARAGTGTTNGIAIRNKDYSTKEQFNNWLSTHNTTVYYASQTPNLIDLNYNVDLTLYSGINNITNSEDMDMVLEYYK